MCSYALRVDGARPKLRMSGFELALGLCTFAKLDFYEMC